MTPMTASDTSACRFDARRTSRLLSLLVLVVLLVVPLSFMLPVPRARAGTPPTGFTDSLVVGGLSAPLSLDFLPDGSGRVIFVEKAGAIRLWDGTTVSTLHTMLEVNTIGNERGLLGVAVDPDWPARPFVYVHYTANTVPPYVQVARFNVTDQGITLSLDPTSKLVLIDDMPDNASNHNGGTLRFGPDKTLYISVGDDALQCNAQALTVLAGKILRIRVDGPIDPSNRATLAPADNPFASAPDDNQKLVWAYGLRNPFRFDIHPLTGDVFIGDVGQSAWEEVSLASASGLNFGWPYWEGSAPYQVGLCPGHTSVPPSQFPIYVYPNGMGSASVIGAAVYRGVNYPVDDSFPPEYDDDFFFMDYYAGFLRVLRWNPFTGVYDLVPGVSPTDWGTTYAFVADMTVGPDGAMYFLTGSALRRIAFTAIVPGQPRNLSAALVNALADVQLTWTLPNPEFDTDHYEVHRATAYDPNRAGYGQVSPDLPLGTSSWTDVGAGAAAGAYFYFVQAVGPGGETTPSPGQVAKFSRALAAQPTLLSTSVTTSSTLVLDNFRGTAAWSIARTFDAWDAADGWKRHVPSRPGNDFPPMDRTRGVWLEVFLPGDFRVAGRVPCSTTLSLRAGWTLVGFPSMTSVTVAAATAGLTGPLILDGYAATAPYYLARLDPGSTMGPTEAYWVYSPVDQPWTIANDPRPSCE